MGFFRHFFRNTTLEKPRFIVSLVKDFASPVKGFGDEPRLCHFLVSGAKSLSPCAAAGAGFASGHSGGADPEFGAHPPHTQRLPGFQFTSEMLLAQSCRGAVPELLHKLLVFVFYYNCRLIPRQKWALDYRHTKVHLPPLKSCPKVNFY